MQPNTKGLRRHAFSTLKAVPLLVQPPKIYEKVPPAPAGLLWWHYAPGVPPLPNPQEYYQNSSWSSWGWRYNDKFQQVTCGSCTWHLAGRYCNGAC